MSTVTVTHRQWQHKSVALRLDPAHRDRKVWEFHCDLCGETELRDSEQEVIDLVVTHVCS